MQGKVNNPKVLLHREADIRFVIVNFVHLELFSSHSETNMGFDMSCCSFFIVNFADLKLFFFTLFFLSKNEKVIMHTNIIGISSFQNGLNDPFSSTGFCFKSKNVEGSHEIKKIYCFLKMHNFEVVTIFLT